MKYYKGTYRVRKPKKYKGDHKKVTYRSHWEKMAFKWCESNKDIEWWSSEELVIPYICQTDKRPHRYYVDLMIRWKDGRTECIEIKPAKQTEKPVMKRGKPKKKYLQEATTYIKNMSKWKAAAKYCKKRGWEFDIWTEDDLKGRGMKLLA